MELAQHYRSSPNRWLLFLAKIILVTLVCAMYARTVRYDFAYDDFLRIVGDPLVRAATMSVTDVRDIFSTPTYPGDLYRPMSTMLHRVVHLWSGLNPHVYHAVQVFLHCLCVILLFELLLQCGLSVSLAWVSVAWFAIHPINVETVANPSGQPEVLALLFGLVALFSSHYACAAKFTSARIFLCALAGIFLACATLTKESAFVFLALIPLLGWYRKLPLRNVLYSWAWLVAFGFGTLILRKLALGDQFLVRNVYFLVSENPLLHGALGFRERLLPAVITLGEYVTQLVLPLHLSADYSVPPPLFWSRVFSPEGILIACIPIVLFGFVLKHRSSMFGAFGLWFFVAFSLTLNIITPIGTIRGERLAYTPSIGFCVFALGLIGHYLNPNVRAAKGRSHPILLMVLIITLLSFSAWKTNQRIPVWRNQDTLFLETAKDAPQSPKALENAGAVWFDSFKNLNKAERYFKDALALDPTRVFSMKYMVNIHILRGNLYEARQWCQRILKIRPNDPEIVEKIEQIDNAMKSLPPDKIE